MTSLAIAALVAVLALNLVTSVVILRSPAFTGAQRATQMLVAWLLPIVGAVVCLVFVTSQSRDDDAGIDRMAFVDGPCAVAGRPDGNGACGCGDGGE